MATSEPGVLFDVDGTLCDTNYLHAVAWSRALREVGETTHTSTLHHHIGMGSDQLLETILGHYNEDAAAAHGRYFEQMHDDVRAFPGAADLLRKVASLGARVVLASSARPATFKVLRSALDADDVIDESTNSEDVETSKPAPDIFLSALEKSDLTAERCIVVGDTVWDVQAARKAGMDCVCVLTGGIAEPVLTDAGAVAVYRDVQDLLDNIDSSPISALFASG